MPPGSVGRFWGVIPDSHPLMAGLQTAHRYGNATLLAERGDWVAACRERKTTPHRRTHFDDVPVEQQWVDEEMNQVFGRDACYVSSIGLSQIAAAQRRHGLLRTIILQQRERIGVRRSGGITSP